jgi:hypothetical protein
VCHMRRRIHVCHMRRRIHVCRLGGTCDQLGLFLQLLPLSWPTVACLPASLSPLSLSVPAPWHEPQERMCRWLFASPHLTVLILILY